jgi:hypothetical protein
MPQYNLIIIGCDNGCTGTIAAFGDGSLIDFREQFSYIWRKPHVKNRNSYMSRIDYPKLLAWIANLKKKSNSIIAVIERPMTDETRFHQTISSHHAQEALMIALESCGVKFCTIDSSEWQKTYLPGISGSKVLKMSSADKAKQLYPKYSDLIEKHGDADAIFIARMGVDHPSKCITDDAKPKAKEKHSLKKIFTTNFDGNKKNEN